MEWVNAYKEILASYNIEGKDTIDLNEIRVTFDSAGDQRWLLFSFQ